MSLAIFCNASAWLLDDPRAGTARASARRARLDARDGGPDTLDALRDELRVRIELGPDGLRFQHGGSIGAVRALYTRPYGRVAPGLPAGAAAGWRAADFPLSDPLAENLMAQEPNFLGALSDVLAARSATACDSVAAVSVSERAHLAAILWQHEIGRAHV